MTDRPTGDEGYSPLMAFPTADFLDFDLRYFEADRRQI